jgi:DNA-binding phage protein
MIEVREYLDSGGGSPFAEWFARLNPKAAAKVATALTRLAAGNFSNVKGVGKTTNSGRKRATMALTRDFKETVRARAARDPKFRRELLREGIESLLSGDIATAKTILRDYINATVGFAEIAEATHIPSKSLMRMLGPSGNPRADNLFVVVSFLQRREGVRFQVKVAAR